MTEFADFVMRWMISIRKSGKLPRLMMAPGKGRNLPAASREGRGNHLHIVNKILGELNYEAAGSVERDRGRHPDLDLH